MHGNEQLIEIPSSILHDLSYGQKVIGTCSSTTELGRSSTTFQLSVLSFRDLGLARYFKTDHTETVSFCFGIPKTPSSQLIMYQLTR
jgi:hypothetical protein